VQTPTDQSKPKPSIVNGILSCFVFGRIIVSEELGACLIAWEELSTVNL